MIRSDGFLTGIRGGEHPVRGVRRVCGGAGPPVCNSPGSLRIPCTSTPPRPPPSFTKLPRATNCDLSWRGRELGAAAAIYGGERTATVAGAWRWCTRLGCGAVMGRLGDWGGPRLSFMAPRESAPRWVVESDPHGRLPPWAASWLKQLTIPGPRASE